MTKHLLYQADLTRLAVEISSKGVAQGMWRDVLVDPCLGCIPFHHPLYVAVPQRFSLQCSEYMLAFVTRRCLARSPAPQAVDVGLRDPQGTIP